MLYNQPYGISDPDAPYINGNPSTGTMGSIPPAASIEHPQREIVNYIVKCNLEPNEGDLLQLAKSVQSGFVNWGQDQGEVNKIVILPVVPIAAYHVGQRFVIRVGYNSTSQVTVNVSAVGAVPLIHTDLSPMNAYELKQNQLIEVAYDGANFQLMAGGAPGGIVTMTAPRDIYVNNSIGSDTLYDGTSPVIVGTIGGPYKTIQKALSTMQFYNLGGWTFNIHVADGVYAETDPINFPVPNGSGWVALYGNISNPMAVSIFNTGTGSCWYIREGGNYSIQGFVFRATAGRPGDGGGGIWMGSSAFVVLGDNYWNTMPGTHFLCGPGGYGFVVGDQYVVGNANTHQTAFGNGVLYNNTGNAILADDPALIIVNNVSIMGGFTTSYDGGQTRPVWSAITGAAKVTGPKYVASGNGVIQTGGRGINYLPGTTAGVLSSGGQYL